MATYMDNIGLLGIIILYAPLAAAVVVGALLIVYAVRRKKYWAGIVGTAIIVIFLSIYFYV